MSNATGLRGVDLFCGAGGMTTAMTMVGIDPVLCANWGRAIDVHAANYPGTEHALADISMSCSSYPSNSTRRSNSSVLRYPRITPRSSSRISGAASLAIGTISADSSTNCTLPSTTSVSLENAYMLSRVRALANRFSTCLTCFGLNCPANCWSTGSISTCEYHTSRLFTRANCRSAER